MAREKDVATKKFMNDNEVFADADSVDLLNMWIGSRIKVDKNRKKAINVCKGLEDWIADEKNQTTKTIIIRMYKKGLELSDIADYTNVDIDKVKDIIKEEQVCVM
jgi:hypothetical protein